MKKILLAENDLFLINVYAGQLRKHGYSISIALDGEIIVNRIKDINPDLLILDADLPGGPATQTGYPSGFSVLKKLREDMGLKGLKVIMLSNFNQEKEVAESLELGVVKCLSKAENTTEEIIEEIKKILS